MARARTTNSLPKKRPRRLFAGQKNFLDVVVYNPKPFTNACGADVFGAAFNDCELTGHFPPGEPSCPPDTSLHFDCGVQIRLALPVAL